MKSETVKLFLFNMDVSHVPQEEGSHKKAFCIIIIIIIIIVITIIIIIIIVIIIVIV